MTRISLKIKVLGIVVITMLMAMALIMWHNLKTQQAMLSRLALENTKVLAETVHNSFITSMAAGENSKVVDILQKIQNSASIEAVRIFDDTGQILLSADPAEVGDFVKSPDLFTSRTNNNYTPHRHEEDDIFCTLLPINNEPACHQCHGSDKAVLGILNLHTTLDHLASLEINGRQATILTSLGVLIFIVVTISGFFLFFVETPIRRLVQAMYRVEQGDFEHGLTSLSGSREMLLVSNKFNGMVTRLQDLIETKLSQEKELAIQQEKIAHHEEVQQMNTTLEERLKEIEFLNISLEERIEEIEEANYKIADLASELENKNVTLQAAVDKLSALYKMGLAINSTMEHETLFSLLLNKTVNTLGARIGYLLLHDSDQSRFSIGAIVGAETKFGNGDILPVMEGGLSKWVIEKRQPLLVEDVRSSDRFTDKGYLGFSRETVICAPLIIKGEVIGTLTIANSIDGSPFTSEDLELLSTIAAQASVAINNSRLYEEQERTYLTMVQALVSAIEASDAYTKGHSERVRHYSLTLAEKLAIGPEATKRLNQAAILHDIGKIGIDIGLLHKKGKLSEEDIEKLRLHPEIGASILEPMHFLSDVTDIIVQHHERVDGKGYPNGLSSEEMLLEAKILAVADTFDAMTSDRPYRKALPVEVAIQEIRDHSGTQFDPQVAEAFIELHGLGQVAC